MEAVTLINVLMHIASHSSVASVCAVIDALQVSSLVEQGNGVYLFQ